MRGGALAPALLCTALGLALAFAPRRIWRWSIATLTVAALALSVAPVPAGWLERVFMGCWISVAVIAATVHLPDGPSEWGALVLSLNTGFWAGSVVAVAGSRLDLLKALPCVLVLVPAALLAGARAPIAVKVVSGWLIAVAVLAATLQLLPVTPGYLPDHLE